MATLVTKAVAPTGLVSAPVAASAGGDSLETGPSIFLRVKTVGTATTVTVNSVALCSYGSDHDLVVVVGTNTEVSIGPLSSRFANAVTGLADVTYSAVTAVTVEAVRV